MASENTEMVLTLPAVATGTMKVKPRTAAGTLKHKLAGKTYGTYKNTRKIRITKPVSKFKQTSFGVPLISTKRFRKRTTTNTGERITTIQSGQVLRKAGNLLRRLMGTYDEASQAVKSEMSLYILDLASKLYAAVKGKERRWGANHPEVFKEHDAISRDMLEYPEYFADFLDDYAERYKEYKKGKKNMPFGSAPTRLDYGIIQMRKFGEDIYHAIRNANRQYEKIISSKMAELDEEIAGLNKLLGAVELGKNNTSATAQRAALQEAKDTAIQKKKDQEEALDLITGSMGGLHL